MIINDQIDHFQSGRYLKNLERRYRKDSLFRIFGLLSLGISFLCLVMILGNILIDGLPSFMKRTITIPLTYEQQMTVQKSDSPLTTLSTILEKTLSDTIGNDHVDPDVLSLISPYAPADLLQEILSFSLPKADTDISLNASDDLDQYFKHQTETLLQTKEIEWAIALKKNNAIKRHFNFDFFTKADSREAEEAGIAGAFMGSFMLIIITALIVIPVGVAAALYLEEFAPKNKFIDLLEVNINNLAAVPSIVFGLLGLSIFINTMHLPRSTPLVGGLVLSLMTLPPLIMNARLAIRSVPASIRHAALGLGASPMQVILHHVIPLSMPGIMTGTIISLARALGETAPLLMIGMVAFIADVAESPLEAATALPVQIYIWANNPEIAFIEKSSGAILVLICLLLMINSIAVYIRQKFEKSW